mmetsp:Transcript_46126/g.76243  ORF Transcript_46126/g.76243 Transcript_46126/m.76243 type:complete len:368 (+) Transcript_46126:32-1135(+)|eukprot:CAMPEP_0119307798 /NCGR_PEP_ID=MMETSP1333-20130426/8193_1 /TAXON_ID=418940 /ORGANISM="Scyphosphaera apsteinii, Strain RCC1455" /LENGTH=367 /DNA_ID=CAMNT_0007311427 /DNA_START=26 /DNA_END=1129 /DNA_ORIENTATION=-
MGGWLGSGGVADGAARSGISRRAVASLAAATSSLSLASSIPAMDSRPCAIAAVAPGFLIAPEQYALYTDLLEELNMPTVVLNDKSTLTRPTPIAEGGAALLAAADAKAQSIGLSDSAPLVLLAHSRGAKAAILAAEMASRPVSAMVLLDPVDATVFEGESILTSLRGLNVPTAICASGAAGECAPRGSNYNEFYNALGSSESIQPPPRLLALLRQAGHMQYLDHRGGILDVCASGKDADSTVHDVALAVLATWLAAFVPNVVPARPLPVPVTIGTGRVSGSYLMLARKASEACAAMEGEPAAAGLHESQYRWPSRLRSLWSPLLRLQREAVTASNTPNLCAKQRGAECLSILEQVRFGTDVQFSIDA